MYNPQYDINGDLGTGANEYVWLVLLLVAAFCAFCAIVRPKPDKRDKNEHR